MAGNTSVTNILFYFFLSTKKKKEYTEHIQKYIPAEFQRIQETGFGGDFSD